MPSNASIVCKQQSGYFNFITSCSCFTLTSHVHWEKCGHYLRDKNSKSLRNFIQKQSLKKYILILMMDCLQHQINMCACNVSRRFFSVLKQIKRHINIVILANEENLLFAFCLTRLECAAPSRSPSSSVTAEVSKYRKQKYNS